MTVQFFELGLVELVTASRDIFPDVFAVAVLEPSPEKLVDNFFESFKADAAFAMPSQIFIGVIG